MNKRVILVINLLLVIPLCAMQIDDNDIEMGRMQSARSTHSEESDATHPGDDHEQAPMLALIRQMTDDHRITLADAHRLKVAHANIVHKLRTDREVGQSIKTSVERIAKDHTQMAELAYDRNRALCGQVCAQSLVTGIGMFGLFLILWGNGDGVSNAIYSTRDSLSDAIYNVKPACYCMCPECPTLALPTPAPANTGSDSATYLNVTCYPQSCSQHEYH